MIITTHRINDIPVAVPEEVEKPFGTVQEILDLMADVHYRGARKIILRKEQLTPAFFDLKTGFAGEVLQKFANYYMQLAIIGDFSQIRSKSLQDFIRESNKGKQVFFVGNTQEAIQYLTR
ncbi:MAG: DUF4180 domain-containing protein [Candidatus Marinimicrobia bacterium]|jgi:predicted glycosyltransferase|nr:DUF4180 domain-containing protein [Candidatus Neomarinimicrobiota bacterium]MDD4961998.1 DUF4180 domain-containing protein [Candidatus Neomarinimicrobiota bacterium]MDD5710086.1 DUF4180 domain-containing protein [Candidatus Neomarinimicrobiota bacterium]MDX9778329.1 DUF4180 domain-containing protein [bacterium]